MFCTKCGKSNDEQSAFCGYCGEKLVKSAKISQANYPEEEIILAEVLNVGNIESVQTDEAEEPDKYHIPVRDGVEENEPELAPIAIPTDEEQTLEMKVGNPPMVEEFAQAPTIQGSEKTRNKLPKKIIIGISSVVVLALIITAAIFIFSNISLGGGKAHYFYTLQEEGFWGMIDSIYTLKSDGSGQQLFAEERSGYFRYFLFTGNSTSNSYVSQDGKSLALWEGDREDGELVLFHKGDSRSISLDDELIFGGFSPDGRYYGATKTGEDREIIIFDRDGDEIYTVRDAIFVEFKDNDEFIYIEYDNRDGEEEGIGIASISKEDEDRLLRFDSRGEIPVRGLSIFNFNKNIYFVDESFLYRTDFAGNDTEEVYEFDGEAHIYAYPDAGFILVYDATLNIEIGRMDGELILIDTKDNTTRISRNAIFQWTPGGISPDGKHIYYFEFDKDGEVELIVAKTNGDDAQTIDSADSIRAQFSADSKHIVYLTDSGNFLPGTLYISSLDGEDQDRLDRDVWSFIAGDKIVYSVIEDGDPVDLPESVIYSVGVNGKNGEAISDEFDGLITFITVP